MISKLKEKIIIKRNNKNISIVARATLWFLVCNIIQKCTSIITMPFFTRIMTTEQMGQYTAYVTWLEIVTIITTLRLDYGVFNKGMSKYPNDQDGYISSMLGITTTLTTITFVIYLIFHNQINKITELSTPISIGIFAELYMVPATRFWLLKQRYAFKYVATITVTLSMTFFNTIIGIVSVMLCDDKGNVRILSCILVNVCFGLCMYIICISKNKKMFNMQYIKFAFCFNLPLIPHYFSSYVLEQSDKIMIQKMVGGAQMGIYGIACSNASVIKIVTASISNAILPWQYRAIEEKKFKEIKDKISSVVYLVTFVVLIFVAVAPDMLRILTDRAYHEAIYVIPPMASGVIFILYFNLVANIEFYYEKNRFTLYVSLICACTNIILNYFMISLFSYTAAAYSTLICYVISSFCHLIYINKLTRKYEGVQLLEIQQLMYVLILTVIGTFVMSLVYDTFIIRYLLVAAGLFVMFLYRKKVYQIIHNLKS